MTQEQMWLVHLWVIFGGHPLVDQKPLKAAMAKAFHAKVIS